jgi:D-arginine dehydrogenase
VIYIARADQTAALDIFLGEHRLHSSIGSLGPADVASQIPIFKHGYVAAAAEDSGALDIDVHAMQQSYLRHYRKNGGAVHTGATVRAMNWSNGRWRVETQDANYSTPLVLNAAGAWADDVARCAGLQPINLVARRRTAVTIDIAEEYLNGTTLGNWPMLIDADEQFYFKPEAGRLLISPADATPDMPHDVQPEELNIAEAIHRFESATCVQVHRLASRWAGLRTFAMDGDPVVGFDPAAQGFFWFAGQGGYGIQIAPAFAKFAAALVRKSKLPQDILDHGIDTASLLIDRFRL